MAQITLTYTYDDLLNWIYQDSLYLAQTLTRQMKDLGVMQEIPLTVNERSWIYGVLYDAATKVAEFISPWNHYESDVDDPITITEGTSIVFDFVINSLVNSDIVTPRLTKSIEKYLVKFVLAQWMKTKGINDHFFILNEEVEGIKLDIKRAMTLNKNIKIPHNTGF